MLSHYDLRKNYPNGDRYNGEATENNVKDGKGTYTWADTGATYSGQWRRDVMHGTGELRDPRGPPDGFAYTGTFEKGVRHGRGRCSFATGRTFEGTWLANEMEGEGCLRCEPGNLDDFIVYTGTFAAGKRHGRGDCEFKDGSRYGGEWHDDRREGVGVFTTSDLWYCGPWRQDERSGPGAVYSAFDVHGNGATRTLYEGDVLRGQRHGRGFMAAAQTSPDATAAQHTLVASIRLLTPDTIPRAVSSAEAVELVADGDWFYDSVRGNARWALVDLAQARGMEAPVRGGLANVCTADKAADGVARLRRYMVPHAAGSLDAVSAPHVIASYTGGWDNGHWTGDGDLVVNVPCFGTTGEASPPHDSRWAVRQYCGAFVGSRFHGAGTATFFHGGQLRGTFNRSVAEGPAEVLEVPVTFPLWVGTAEAPLDHDPEVAARTRLNYVGALVGGVYNDNSGDAVATTVLPDGRQWTYQGAFEAGVPSGHGELTVKVQARRGTTTSFTGQFAAGLPNGDGSLSVDDGVMRSTYQGALLAGQRCGEGRASLTSGGEPVSHYTGEWQEDMYHGQGRFQDAASSDSYSGGWLRGKRNGASGCVAIEYGRSHYTGGYLDDQKHGRGVLKFNDGTVYAGGFAEGTYNGRGTLTLKDGVTVFTGSFAHGKVHGSAEAKMANGNVYNGGFIDGVMSGGGEMRYTNGDRYHGELHRGERRGKGVMHFAGGGTLTARWNDAGLLDGEARFDPPAVAGAPQPTRRWYDEGTLVREQPLGDAEWLTPPRRNTIGDQPKDDSAGRSRTMAIEHTVAEQWARPIPVASQAAPPTMPLSLQGLSKAAPIERGQHGDPTASAAHFAEASPHLSEADCRRRIDEAEVSLGELESQLAGMGIDDPGRRAVQRKMALQRATRARAQRKLDSLQ